MSLRQINLCCLLLREEFGEVVEKVCVYLLRKGASPAGIIAQKTDLKLSQVKQVLCVLIQHNLVTFEHHKRGFVEYSAIIHNVLVRRRFPHYLYAAKTLYGDAAELITEELLHNGQMEMDVILGRVSEKLKEALEESSHSLHQVREKFVNLAQTHFIQRCPLVVKEGQESGPSVVPVFKEDEENELFVVPELGDTRKRKRSLDDSEEPSKRVKMDKVKVKMEEGGIYWMVNYDRFDRHLRDQNIIKAVTRKVDMRAGEIIRTLLRLSELTSDVTASSTNQLSYNEIFQALPQDLGLTRQTLDQYLKILVEDSMAFLNKAGDSGGGLYYINFQKAFNSLCTAHIESVVQERFGSKSLRIYRLLVLKKQLEQKQIEEFAMVPAKEAKELLYAMFSEHFVALTEVPRTPDHAPSRTFFLFSVNVNQVARMLLERCYKALTNLIIKRNQETTENKRLLEKQQRMEAIITSLEQSGAEDSQKQEIEEMITPTERTQIHKVRNNTKKLEQAELQLDETVFVIQMYIKYIHMK